MTQAEFDLLRIGDIVIITGMSNGKKAVGPWELLTGHSAEIIGKGHGYWRGVTDTKELADFLYPDEIDFPLPTEIRCECGAASVGIKLFTPGHSRWCPGKQVNE